MIQGLGVKLESTFWMDFTIADKMGEKSVKDTYDRAFNEWKNNPKFMTELTIVLNWKIWQHYKENKEVAEVYNDLWEQADAYACENLTGAESDYFYSTTDNGSIEYMKLIKHIFDPKNILNPGKIL